MIKEGWTTSGGSKVIPTVAIIRDIRQQPDAHDGTKTYCKAIIETDKGNFIYMFWYTYDPSIGVGNIHGRFLNSLDDKLSEKTTQDNIIPYSESALAAVNSYATTIVDLRLCNYRTPQWLEELRQKSIVFYY